jgi:hypothetical protein
MGDPVPVLTLSEAVAAVRALPREGRGAALRGLAAAACHRAGAGDGFTVFDPLECTPDLSGACPERRPPFGEDRVCLVHLDSEVACPHGGTER